MGVHPERSRREQFLSTSAPAKPPEICLSLLFLLLFFRFRCIKLHIGGAIIVWRSAPSSVDPRRAINTVLKKLNRDGILDESVGDRLTRHHQGTIRHLRGNTRHLQRNTRHHQRNKRHLCRNARHRQSTPRHIWRIKRHPKSNSF
jgi:hypothetical protein